MSRANMNDEKATIMKRYEYPCEYTLKDGTKRSYIKVFYKETGTNERPGKPAAVWDEYHRKKVYDQFIILGHRYSSIHAILQAQGMTKRLTKYHIKKIIETYDSWDNNSEGEDSE